MADSNAQDSPFPDVPAPWKCKGECFWFFGLAKGTAYPGPSSFSALEGASPFADAKVSGEFKGGLSSIMVVRYTETPAGPYDEIIWMPGEFTIPQTGKKANRITRIYVSTKESVYNGRKNWNICKTLAHFTFTRNPDASSTDLPYSRIAIAPIDTPEAPFFLIDLLPIPLLSKGLIPFNAAYMPMSSEIVCPPLPQSTNWRENACVGTDEWITITPGMKGKAGLFRFKGALEGGAIADDVGFPASQPWPIAMWLREFDLDFPVGIVPGSDKKRL